MKVSHKVTANVLVNLFSHTLRKMFFFRTEKEVKTPYEGVGYKYSKMNMVKGAHKDGS